MLVDELESESRLWSYYALFCSMDPDLKTTLREFKEYLDLSYESPREFAGRIGVAKETIWYWLSGRRRPKAQSLMKLRRFLDVEALMKATLFGVACTLATTPST